MGCQKWLRLCAQFFSLISDGLGGVFSHLLNIWYLCSHILKRPQKFETISHVIWHLLSKRQIKWEIVSNFCGLFRMSELYTRVCYVGSPEHCCTKLADAQIRIPWKLIILRSQKLIYGGSLPKGPFLYYVRVFWGFFEPPTHLRKDIFTT